MKQVNKLIPMSGPKMTAAECIRHKFSKQKLAVRVTYYGDIVRPDRQIWAPGEVPRGIYDVALATLSGEYDSKAIRFRADTTHRGLAGRDGQRIKLIEIWPATPTEVSRVYQFNKYWSQKKKSVTTTPAVAATHHAKNTPPTEVKVSAGVATAPQSGITPPSVELPAHCTATRDELALSNMRQLLQQPAPAFAKILRQVLHSLSNQSRYACFGFCSLLLTTAMSATFQQQLLYAGNSGRCYLPAEQSALLLWLFDADGATQQLLRDSIRRFAAT